MSKNFISTEYPKSKRFIDRTGELYNAWQIQGFSHHVINKKSLTRNTYWNCLCTDCGITEKPIPLNNLKTGMSKSCGCSVERLEKQNNLVGKTYGHLKVLRCDREKTKEMKASYWVTHCDICGSETSKPGNRLSRGFVSSCGSISCRNVVRSETCALKRSKQVDG